MKIGKKLQGEWLGNNLKKIRSKSATLLSKKSYTKKASLLIITSALLSFLLIPFETINLKYYSVGEIATSDVKSPMDILVEDTEATKTKQAEAERSVYPVYDYFTNFYDRIEMKLTDVFKWSREQLERDEKNLTKEAFLQNLPLTLTDSEFNTLKINKFSPFIERNIKNLLNIALNGKIVTKSYKELEGRRGITMRLYYFTLDGTMTFGKEVTATDLSRIQSYEDASIMIKEAGLRNLRHVSKSLKNTIISISRQLLEPNLVFNRVKTDERIQLAKQNVNPVLFQIKKGEIIVREGERINATTLLKLNAIRKTKNTLKTFLKFLGVFLMLGLIGYITASFVSMSIKKFEADEKNFLFIAALLTLFIILLKVFFFIGEALQMKFNLPPHIYNYLIPVAMSGMIVRAMKNSETAIVLSGIFAILSSMLFGESLEFAVYTFVGCISGAHFVAYCTQRSTLIRGGVKTGFVNMGMALTFFMIKGEGGITYLLFALSFGFFSGILSSIIATGIIPILESLFGYATDMRLLELVSIEHPLLKELSIKAPGSYHHSIMVATLAEAAARSIHANPVIAKVGAYFHDVGKAKMPHYYIENQLDWENKHDNITPRMSSLIILSHVKEGIELGRRYKIPKVISDIIIQHHGTHLIEYFYEKAKEMPGGEEVSEIDYRYPGPKPQTREAGIIMLADAIEAASKTLKDKSLPQIQYMVEKIISHIFSDGQLEECMLTLKDLHEISRSFVKILAGYYHHRIDYPIQLHLQTERDKEDGNHTQKTDPQDKDRKNKKDSDIFTKKIGLS